jgi:hypothetical protein
MFYSGGAEDQIEAFMEKNPTYLWYNPIFNTNYNKEKKDDKNHPWYAFFDENKDLDNAETSSKALAAKTTGDILVFGAVEWQTKGQTSFFAQKEIPTLHERLRDGKIKSINHMKKGATKPSQIIATEDKDGKLTWINGAKEGDTNASGAYDVCPTGVLGIFQLLTSCGAPKPNHKCAKAESVPPPTVKPSKGMSLSIAMVTTVAPHDFGASETHEWKFYTTMVNEAVGSCGETKGKQIPAESNDKPHPVGDYDTNAPYPGGIFKLNIEGEACTYYCDGTNPGRLFCPQRQIGCKTDSNKNKKWLRCGSTQFFHPSVYCDF